MPKSPLRLFTEAKSFDYTPVEGLVESSTKADGTTGKTHYIQGVYIQANVKNRNLRNYPKALMEQCVAKYMADRMNPQKGFRSYGELGHPDGVEVNLDKVCHFVQSLEWQGNNCIGKSEVLEDLPNGRIVCTFLDKKLRLGVSTRGLGALAKTPSADGSKMVEAYDMIAIDVVSDPSAPQGFVDGILENKQYIVKDDGLIVECYENLEEAVSTLPNGSETRNKYFLNALEKFLSEIRNRDYK